MIDGFPFLRLITCLSILLFGYVASGGEEIFLAPEAFIQKSFEEEPETRVLWLTRDIKESMERVLEHPHKGLRLRYWQAGARTAWILEAIGKTEPITAGFTIEDDRICDMQVLVYRESHGWEVRYPFFTTQFHGLGLENKNELDRRIDGISGATMSVNALVRLSRIALILHREVVK